MTVRTRFAPSPTGYLHVGSARTALFSWAYARRHGGQFILRIEDTDRARSTDEAIEIILESMAWLGMDYDEGPIYQTQRMARYGEVIEQLLQSGHAYRCRCSKERLESLRETQQQAKQKPRYDGCCREKEHPHTDEPYVIRFKNPLIGSVIFDDGVHGSIEVANAELDDLIIQRSDGMPTYNFCVVVDDADMKISHVIRGSDHINNTPRQINIFNALNLPVPSYTHVPMILGSDGKKLSKRHGAVSVMQYREEGYLASALMNYLCRLGWSHGDQEIFSRDEMIALFDMANISKSPARFDTEKLLWLNQHYIKESDPAQLAPEVLLQMETMPLNISAGPDVKAVIVLQQERAKTVKQIAQDSWYFYHEVNEYDEKAAKKFLTPESIPIYDAIIAGLGGLQNWQAEQIHSVVHQIAEDLNVKLGKVAQPIRVAITGGTVSPPIDITLAMLGQEKTLTRLANAKEMCKES